MEREFNLNNYVKVKLTMVGRELHRKYYEDIFANGVLSKYEPPKEDADGWSRWQMWHLMEIFGPHLYNGCKVPFQMSVKIEIPD